MTRKANSHNQEHGTTRSYVIGFVLSIIFTIIPYHLVVNEVLAGSTLLNTILGIAILQMFIQIFFFLHLGRGPKPLYNVVFFFGTAGIIVIVVGASLFIMNNLYRNMSPGEATRRLAQKEGIAQVGGEETGACQGNQDNHIVTISGNIVSPSQINAKRCDTLTFVNKDAVKREIIFGDHLKHVSYGGEDYVILDDNRPETITLNELGTFVYHDEQQSLINGMFIVVPR